MQIIMICGKARSGKDTLADYLIKGIYAGMMIGIGGIAFLSLENKIAGSFFFSLGLLCVCMYGMNLYTGKIGCAILWPFNYMGRYTLYIFLYLGICIFPIEHELFGHLILLIYLFCF